MLLSLVYLSLWPHLTLLNGYLSRCRELTTIADLEELIPIDMLEYSTKQGLLFGIVLHPTGSRKRTYSTPMVAAAMIALPLDCWAQPKPSKRFKRH